MQRLKRMEAANKIMIEDTGDEVQSQSCSP